MLLVRWKGRRHCDMIVLVVPALCLAALCLLQASADVTSEQSCDPVPSPETACSWIDTCGVAGCSGSCVMNHLRMKNNIAVSSRDWSDDSWRLCPELASWVNATREPQPDVSRRLHGEEGARGTGVSLLKRFARELKRLDEVRGSSIPATERLGEHFEFDTEQLRMRKLRQFSSDGVSPLAAPAGDEDIPAELTLACPTNEEIDQATAQLIRFGLAIEAVFDQLLDPDSPALSGLSEWEFVLDNPNKYLVLMEFFQDPSKLMQYMQTNCEDRLVDYNDGAGYGRWSASIYVNTTESELATTDVLKVCADTNGAWQQFHVNYHRIKLSCDPPFSLNPSCYANNTWFFIMSSERCSEAWDRTFNTTAPDILQQLSQVNQDTHRACTALTTQELCTETESPEIQDLLEESDNVQTQIPFKTTNPLGPAVFEALKKPQTTAPGVPPAAAPNPSGTPADTLIAPGDVSEDDPSNVDEAQQSGTKPRSKTKKSFPVGAVVGPLVGAILLVLLGVCAAVCVRRRRGKQRNAKAHAAVQQVAPPPDPPKLHQPPTTEQLYPSRTRGTYWSTNTTDCGPSRPPELHSPLPSLLLPPSPSLANASSFGTPTGYSQYSTPHPPSSVRCSGQGQGSLNAANARASQVSTPTAAAGRQYHAAGGGGDRFAIGQQASPHSGYGQPHSVQGTGSDAGSAHGGGADRGSQLSAKLCQELDLMHRLNQCFAQRYSLMGASDRGIGSFGVVQLATVDRLGDVVAVKIFTDVAGFANEQRVYGIKAVADAVGGPPIFMHNRDRAALDPSGWPFPPFTVTEMGQPLQAWMKCYSADILTCMQVLGQVLNVVKVLHEAGYAHRNIKPSNILQRERQHDWILIDFCSSCPLNCVAPLPSSHNSLEYAAPEIIAGIKPGVATCASATAAADMWALGMVAFELLTNEPLFAPGTAPKTIRAALAGRKPLPWEDGAEGAEQRRRKLRGLQRLVMPCLARDPQQRPAAGVVLQSWHSMFDDMRTRGTFADSFRVC